MPITKEPISAQELRDKFLDFFKSKGHAIIPSASLIPENDPTVLFTTAGMHPLVPYLMGEPHPEGRRLANVQKCVRTDDIEEVGDRTHHTFFEMLGNWSLGDYFKREAISWSWEFLTSPDWLGLDKKLLAVSVFAGDDDAPFDEEAYKIWKDEIGIAPERIAKLPKKNNWWGPAGETGPCGPDTEMFYWTGDPEKVPASFNDDNEYWVEIWNDVFMEYNKTKDRRYEKLPMQNVDTGMGLERVLAILNGYDDNFRTVLFSHCIARLQFISGKKYGESEEVTRAMRIITDHLKAATFMIGDPNGVPPSNTGRGYIVRRLIRRAVRYGKMIGIENYKIGNIVDESWTKEIAKIIVHDYYRQYPELQSNVDRIVTEIKNEELKFKATLEKGLKEFEKITQKLGGGKSIDGDRAFDLYQTYGFPVEMTVEMAREKGLSVDLAGFDSEMQKHQELSRTASAGMFKGGLADASDETRRLHTAAHLMLAALRKVLGMDVRQKGSHITADRLRFDFSFERKLSPDEIAKVEELVNSAIEQDLPVTCMEMTVAAAKEYGAIGAFESRYGEHVKVYTVGEGEGIFSKEICGGPHVERTGQLGRFKIKKEESSSAGVRRIKAVLG